MNAVDLFCGCGGMSLGFQNAGINILAAYDNWEPAVNVYRKNFTHPIYADDLSDETVQDRIAEMRPELIFGGPPCQDFSSAGHRNESLGRASLSVSFANIIVKAMPEYFVMENVPEITKSETITNIIPVFRKVGYAITKIVLDASLCGVPQSRKRFFMIGHLNDRDDFLKDLLEENLADKPMSMFDYFGDSLGTEYYFRVPRSYSRRGVFSIYEPCQTIRGVDRPIPKGYKGHPADPVEIGPKVRALTILERSYVQTFPTTFVFEGNKTNLNQMIGNAVPVKLAEYVAKALVKYDAQFQEGVTTNENA
jgi:DNA (cytosine-5)-methyltransferase 1